MLAIYSCCILVCIFMIKRRVHKNSEKFRSIPIDWIFSVRYFTHYLLYFFFRLPWQSQAEPLEAGDPQSSLLSSYPFLHEPGVGRRWISASQTEVCLRRCAAILQTACFGQSPRGVEHVDGTLLDPPASTAGATICWPRHSLLRALVWHHYAATTTATPIMPTNLLPEVWHPHARRWSRSEGLKECETNSSKPFPTSPPRVPHSAIWFADEFASESAGIPPSYLVPCPRKINWKIAFYNQHIVDSRMFASKDVERTTERSSRRVPLSAIDSILRLQSQWLCHRVLSVFSFVKNHLDPISRLLNSRKPALMFSAFCCFPSLLVWLSISTWYWFVEDLFFGPKSARLNEYWLRIFFVPKHSISSRETTGELGIAFLNRNDLPFQKLNWIFRKNAAHTAHISSASSNHRRTSLGSLQC